MKLPHLRLESKKVEFAETYAFVIRTNPFFKNNKGLYMHEYEHVKQFYIAWAITSILLGYFYPVMILFGFFTHGVLYTFIKKYRLWSEVKAFRKQIAVNGDTVDYYAKTLSTSYNLNISFENAKKLLS
jgi:hypothetical protein